MSETWLRFPCGSEANCVEVTLEDGWVILRSSTGVVPEVLLTKAEWVGFVGAVKAGDADEFTATL